LKTLQELKLRTAQTKVKTVEEMVSPEHSVFLRRKGQLYLVYLWQDFTPETLASFQRPCWHSQVIKWKTHEKGAVWTKDIPDDEIDQMAEFAMAILKDLPGPGGLESSEQKEWATRGPLGVHAFKYCWVEAAAPPVPETNPE
jgi:hypothetical protein